MRKSLSGGHSNWSAEELLLPPMAMRGLSNRRLIWIIRLFRNCKPPTTRNKMISFPPPRRWTHFPRQSYKNSMAAGNAIHRLRESISLAFHLVFQWRLLEMLFSHNLPTSIVRNFVSSSSNLNNQKRISPSERAAVVLILTNHPPLIAIWFPETSDRSRAVDLWPPGRVQF